MANIPNLPNYQASYKDWHTALGYRLQYAELAIGQTDLQEKVNAQACLYEFIEASPPQCDDLDQIAFSEISAIHLQNINDQLKALQTNRSKYLEIGSLLKKISAKIS